MKARDRTRPRARPVWAVATRGAVVVTPGTGIGLRAAWPRLATVRQQWCNNDEGEAECRLRLRRTGALRGAPRGGWGPFRRRAPGGRHRARSYVGSKRRARTTFRASAAGRGHASRRPAAWPTRPQHPMRANAGHGDDCGHRGCGPTCVDSGQGALPARRATST